MKPPYPSCPEPWHPSVAEDYSHARSDNERRRMLQSFGVDSAHIAEADRLFPKYAEYKKHEEEKKQGLAKYYIRQVPRRLECVLYNIEQRTSVYVRFIELVLAVYGFIDLIVKAVGGVKAFVALLQSLG